MRFIIILMALFPIITNAGSGVEIDGVASAKGAGVNLHISRDYSPWTFGFSIGTIYYTSVYTVDHEINDRSAVARKYVNAAPMNWAIDTTPLIGRKLPMSLGRIYTGAGIIRGKQCDLYREVPPAIFDDHNYCYDMKDTTKLNLVLGYTYQIRMMAVGVEYSIARGVGGVFGISF